MEPLPVSVFRQALLEVAELLEREGEGARLYLVGGAAIAFAYNADRLTRDMDGLVTVGHGSFMRAVQKVARSRGWPTTWINEQVSSYLPPAEDTQIRTVFDHPALQVVVPSPRHLLAMKAISFRASDISDLQLMMRLAGIESISDVEEIVSSVFPGVRLTPAQRSWVADALADTPDPSDADPPAIEL